MKKLLTGIVVFLFVLGSTSAVQAYSYSFDIQSGSLNMTVAQGYENLTIATSTSLVVGYDSIPALDSTMDYDYSLGVDLGLVYSVTIPVPDLFGGAINMTDSISFNQSLVLGGQGINLDEWITLGGTSIYNDSVRLNGEFEGYTLNNVLLSYNLSIVNDAAVEMLALNITSVSLSEGNIADTLSALASSLTMELVGTDLSGFISAFGLTAEVTFTSGTLDLAATPVPTPATVWLLVSGLAGLVGLRRSRA
ncbi:VPLPA-CTERM sorting domain-containing protein [Desulfospira joergensenii]|uniref:VPLPA-CTERM sorting domain-containing protein n=1 Tax=Desulfospira joergensenii TaxID=53329 RepID=UPI0003B4134B|nr:VPLPA-CTERM sorting domain-containing protein [Desulfospira joergensenii]